MRGSTLKLALAIALLVVGAGASTNGLPDARAGLPTADLSLTKSDSPDPVAAGGSLTYTLTVDNQGPAASGFATLSDPLPGSTTFVSASPGCEYLFSSDTVRCDLEPIDSGASVQVQIQVVANEAGTIVNSATVDGPDHFDPDHTNNSASEQTTVQGEAPPGSVSADFIAPTKAKARELIVLDASKTTGAKRLLWDLNGDRRTDLVADAASHFVGLRLRRPRSYDIGLTAVAADGSVSTARRTITVANAGRRLVPGSPDVGIASPYRPGVGRFDLPCLARTKVTFGVVEAEGCFKDVARPEDIPEAERPVAGAYLREAQSRTVDYGGCACPEGGAQWGFEVFVSEGSIQLNGITVTPTGRASVVVFPGLQRVVSSNAELSLYSPQLGRRIVIRSGPLNLDVTGARNLWGSRYAYQLFTFNPLGNLSDIGGFTLAGQMTLSLVRDGGRRFTEAAIHLALPSIFGVFGRTPPTGDATVEADNDNDLMLNTIALRVDEAQIGGLRLSNLSFTYKHAGEPSQSCPRRWWKATAEIYLGLQNAGGFRLAPPPQRNGVAFCAGGFHSAGGELIFDPPLPKPQLFPGVFLDAIAFNIQLDNPTVLDGGATISAASIVQARGGLLTAFASPGAPYVIQAEDGNGTLGPLAGRRLTSTSFAVGGTVGIKTPVGVLDLGGGYFLYAYPSYIAAGGHVRVNLLFFVVNAGGSAELSTSTGRYNVHAHGEICLAGGIKIAGIGACAGGQAWVSNNGAVVCFELPGINPGVGYHWGDTFPEIYLGALGDGCKPSRYWEANVQRARALARRETLLAVGLPEHASASGGQVAFTVKRGEKVKNVRLTGAGGAPAVEVRAPDGETLATVPNEIQLGTRLRVLAHEAAGRTWIGVLNGKPGTYVITPQAGSVPITRIASTRPEKTRLSATVAGEGRRRILRYDVGRAGGRRVTFFERGHATWRRLGTARRGKGSIRFTPTLGPGGRREIVAQVTVDGIPESQRVLDRFKAPPPRRPRRPARVRARRHGNALSISWTRSAGAAGYGVLVRQRNGKQRVEHVPAKRRSLRIRPVPRNQGGIVKVFARGALGDWSPPRTDDFAATRRPPTRLLPFSELRRGRG